MSIIHLNGRITLNQTMYLQTVLERFEITDSKTLFIFMNESFSNIVMFFDDRYRAITDIVYRHRL